MPSMLVLSQHSLRGVGVILPPAGFFGGEFFDVFAVYAAGGAAFDGNMENLLVDALAFGGIFRRASGLPSCNNFAVFGA